MTTRGVGKKCEEKRGRGWMDRRDERGKRGRSLVVVVVEDGLSAYFKDKPAHPSPTETPAEPSAIITIRYDYAIIVTQPTRREGKITPVN